MTTRCRTKNATIWNPMLGHPWAAISCKATRCRQSLFCHESARSCERIEKIYQHEKKKKDMNIWKNVMISYERSCTITSCELCLVGSQRCFVRCPFIERNVGNTCPKTFQEGSRDKKKLLDFLVLWNAQGVPLTPGTFHSCRNAAAEAVMDLNHVPTACSLNFKF